MTERRDSFGKNLTSHFPQRGREPNNNIRKDPVEPLNSADVESAMDLILSSDIFMTSGGSLIEKVRAEVVGRENPANPITPVKPAVSTNPIISSGPLNPANPTSLAEPKYPTNSIKPIVSSGDEPLPQIQCRVEGTLNGCPVEFESYLIDDTTYVPLRPLAAALGLQIKWVEGKYHIFTAASD